LSTLSFINDFYSILNLIFKEKGLKERAAGATVMVMGVLFITLA